jgi:hypothetical protein
MNQKPGGQARSCPDCGAEMRPILLFDQADGDRHADLEYATESGCWPFRRPRAGKITAVMCSSCHRVLLYGVPD